ncbi:predicted protein [Coccidioides posadasii str. Silveira]|uniref:Predicted protein n=1 Tax=Coccidioides posadasii (strain RMSCC 757 / Silveira) TaxID=443226 RepID=E9DBS2_COCPS|nr:predicted protein [Coccidioides posadasii str. Silveira]
MAARCSRNKLVGKAFYCRVCLAPSNYMTHRLPKTCYDLKKTKACESRKKTWDATMENGSEYMQQVQDTRAPKAASS